MDDHGHDHSHADHGHGHSHGYGHAHGPASYDRAFAIGIGLNLVFIAAETVFGFAANSLALLADAAHNLSDVRRLALAWGAAWLARRKADNAPDLRLPPRLDPRRRRQCHPADGGDRRHPGGSGAAVSEPQRSRAAR